MGLDRRTFLQGTGLAVLAMGMGAMGGDRLTPLGIASHFQALAQSKKRKFALLVGIDRYGKDTLLQGCKTDVELQRELLIYRLGFDPRDILVLNDDRATPEQIETAFSEDFLLQAKAEDIVVFHFSGFGSKISLPNTETGIASTSNVGEEGNTEAILANCLLCGGESLGKAGILENTLFARARSLPTKNVTMVFDTSYAGNENSLQGNARSRFLPAVDFSVSGDESAKQPQPSSPPGVLLKAAREGETAIEVVWDGFSAGLFTYTLVQALWQTTAPNTLQATFSRSAAQMQGIGNQRPQKLGRKAGDASIAAYFTQPESLSSAEGAIAEVDDNGKSVSLHLAGLPITALQNYAANSQLMAGDPESAIALKVVSRSGLTVKAERIDNEETRERSLSPGWLVRESLRRLPRNIGLIVALDAKFSRIERVDATSAFANIATVSSVVTAGEQSADCLFSRASTVNSDLEGETDKPSLPQGYGLFSTGFVALPNTLGLGDEAIKAAVERLMPKFNVLLAAKLWQAIVNEASSQLAVRVGFQATNPQHPQTIERSTRGFEAQKPRTNHFEKAFPAFPSGESVRFKIENAGHRPIYLTMVGVNATGVPLVLSDQSNDTGIEIAPDSILSIPKAALTLNGFTTTTPGIEEIVVICSRSPFENLARVLATLSPSGGQGKGLIEAGKPLEIARALLQDLNDASDLSTSDSEYALDVKAWAALRFVYEVI
ncbi:MAG: caspase family protein [Cyanobacteria bacterium SBLK]|nr:caspase family protein [Cyanobacteria bacterium SBLK]